MKRQEAMKILDEVIPPPEHHTVDLDHLPIAQAWLCIKEMLTAEPKKHGHWVFDDPLKGDFMCDNCLERNIVCTKYCPNCGAKMDEVEE